jgi:hypothetical protein
MKNIFKIMGIIAFVAVIGFSFTSCGGGGGGGSTLNNDPKTIVITGIPNSFNGKEAGILVQKSLEDWDREKAGMGTIAGGSVTAALWKDDKEWTGTGDYYVTFLLITGSDISDFNHTKTKVSIKSANTAIAWSEFEEYVWE